MSFLRPHWKQSVFLFLGSLIFFAIEVQYPVAKVYDEFHYVPASKNIVSTWTNTNWEHPPLAKWIMGAGIVIFGDEPVGWRSMSVLFGALTIWGMYALAMALFQKKSTALWVALLTIANQMVYVQARIGMLDTFMVAFMVWGMAAWVYTLQKSVKTLTLPILGGIAFGCATACKWYGVIPWVFCVGAAVAFMPIKLSKVPFKTLLVAGVIVPVITYAISYLPQLHEATGLVDAFQKWWHFQTESYGGQLRVVDKHNYMSDWITWPWMSRPIWYAFERDGEFVRCILMMGNPLIMWTGLVAVLMLIPDVLPRPKSMAPLWILLAYGALYLCWGVIPRKIAFYYYYYPAALILNLALAHCFFSREKKGNIYWKRPSFWFLMASISVFIYFFPILSGMRIAPESFRDWMWFRSWI